VKFAEIMLRKWNGKGFGRWVWRRPSTVEWILFIILLIFGGLTYLAGGYDPLPFTTSSWLKADAESRGYMVNDLLKKHEMVGKKQHDIYRLLGKPNHVKRKSGQLSQDELLTIYGKYGKVETGGWLHAYYSLGYLGARAPFALPFFLYIGFHNGVVEVV